MSGTQINIRKSRPMRSAMRAHGRFESSFRLPPSVARDKITANFAHGVPTIVLPNSPEARQRETTIPVAAGG